MGNRIVLSLGSNFGDRENNVREAASWLSRLLDDSRCSDFYETPEVHGKGSPYINAVITGITDDSYDDINSWLKQYEVLAGRDDECRSKGFVPIDIDIVVWNDEVVRPFDFSARFFTIGYNALLAPHQH